MSVKKQVLKILEENKGASISGETLAETMDVSRTAVWKAVQSLRDEGYKIDALTNRGYCLLEENDILSVPGIGNHLEEQFKSIDLHVYKTVDSTNNVAKKLAAEGAGHGTVVLAVHQTHGKGRLGRTFISPANSGIYLTLLLKPSFDMSQSVLITSAASVAVCRAIEKVCGQTPSIKWVNDLYLDGKKICGILTEAMTDFESGTIEYVALGIGINCHIGSLPEDLRSIAGALEGDFSKNQLAAEVINQTLSIVEDIEARSFISEYKERSFVLGKQIRIYKTGYSDTAVPLNGCALDIDQNGGLVVLYSDGQRETLSSGEISIRL